MTIKTFDPNRVGGGTFQLQQDATGAYTIKEVGFVKLPDLKLPEINQAAYTAPPTDDDDTTPDPCPPGFKLVDGVCQRIQTNDGGGGGGGQNNFDYTGETQLKNIQEEATKFSNQDMGLNRVDRTDINQGAVQVEDIGNNEKRNDALSAYNKAINNYNTITGNIRELNASGQATDVSRKAYDISLNNAQKQLDDARKEYEYRSGLDLEGTASSEIMKAAPVIGDFSAGARTIGDPKLASDKFKYAIGPQSVNVTSNKNLEATKPSAMENVKKLLDPKNSLPVKILSGVGTALKGFNDAIIGPQQVALNKSNKNALDSLGYKTNFELGNSTDPGRIRSAVNPDGSVTTSAIDNVFIGMNRASAVGNVMSGARKRVSTVQKTIDKAIAKGDTAKAKRFQERKERYNAQIEAAQAKKNQADLATGGVAPGASSGGDGDPGCFIKGTLITMFDGSKKPVEQVDLGDNVAIGGNVFAVGKFLNTELYDYKGIKVSGSHMVNEDGTWMRVRDTKHGKSLGDDLNTVYVFGSENRRILIDNILFTDYFEVSEQDQLINNEEDFFNNWKSYGNTINEHNVNTLNAN